MNAMQTFTIRGLGRALLSGLKMGLATALFYGLAFCLVAIPRSSVQIVSSISLAEGMFAMLLANAVNIYLLAMEFAFGLGLIAALFCAFTLAGVYLLVSIFRANTVRMRLWIGLAASLALAVLLHILLWPVEGIPHAMLFRSVGAYLFWLGAPCLIYITLTGWMSAKSFPHLKKAR